MLQQLVQTGLYRQTLNCTNPRSMQSRTAAVLLLREATISLCNGESQPPFRKDLLRFVFNPTHHARINKI